MQKDRLSQLYGADLLLIGTSYKTSPLQVREELLRRISFDGLGLDDASYISEYALLQTCNRIEIYAVTDNLESVRKWMQQSFWNKFDERYFYIKTGIEAIEHLYLVASGLDSMLLGEDQILEQVRKAGVDSRKMGIAKRILSSLFDTAVSTGERVRHLIHNKEKEVSIGSFAMRFAKERINLNEKSKVLLIGTGKTIILASRQLNLDASQIYFATKRSSSPKGLEGAHMITYPEIPQVAEQSDLIICATNSYDYVLKKEFFSEGKKRLIIDLAVPRNVDPRVGEVRGIELYSLDDLSEEFNSMSRIAPQEREKALQLIRDEAERFRRWLIAARLNPTLSELYKWAEELRKQEVQRMKRRMHDASEMKLIEVMSRRLLSKLLYPPTKYVKSAPDQTQELRRLETIARVFGLDE